MLNTMQLAGAIRYALFAGAASVLAAPAFAQDDAAPQTLDRVEVLGTRIKQIDIETALPVLVLSREQIERTGLTQIADILREISVNGPSLSLNTNTGNPSGNSNVNLRNCAPNRTLVLVNGRRWVSSNALTGSVDLSSIPLAAVENIQVLKDGASALYGSDALCGVINVQTRRNFDGAEAESYYGQYAQGDGARISASFTIGGTTDRWSTLLNVGYTEQDPVSAADRAISAVPLFGFPATVSTPGRASPVGPFGTFTVPGGPALTLNPSRPGCVANRLCAPASVGDFRPFNFQTDGYNFAQETFLIQPQNTRNLFAQTSYDINEYARFTSEVFYVKREGQAQLAAQPLRPITISAQSIYNPFGVTIIGASFRPTKFPRQLNQEQDTWRFSGGFEGSFGFADRYFAWDVGYVYADNRQLQPKDGFYFSTRVDQATGPSFIDSAGVARCGTPTAIIAGCVPMNVLGGPSGFTQAMYDFIAVSPKNIQEASQESYTANLSGELFDLPAGKVNFAAGYEWRREAGSDTPDPLTAAGLVLGDNPYLPTRGRYTVEEFYAEIQLPLLADVVFARSLDLSLAARASDYTTFGDTTNPKASLRWQPTEELLVRGSWGEGFRAPSVSELFAGVHTDRPTFQDPCSNNNPAFLASAGTRALCQATGTPAGFRSQLSRTFASSGGNVNLHPETSVSKTLGFVYSPDWAEGLNMFVDWYSIVIENQIGAQGAQTILNNCYVAFDQTACALITRDRVGTVNGNPGEVSGIIAQNRNFRGGLETEGFDFGASYRFETGSYGSFDVRFDNTYVSYFGDVDKPERGEVNGDNEISAGNVVGQLPAGSPAGAPRHRLRSNLSTTWSMGDWSLTATMEYRSRVRESCTNVNNTANALAVVNPAFRELRNLCSNPDFLINQYRFRPGTAIIESVPTVTPINFLGGTTYTHLQGSWKTPWNANLSVGVRNLFDKDPPFSSDAPQNSFDAQYLIPGRFYYMSYRQSF